jgi:hypothetical protein
MGHTATFRGRTVFVILKTGERFTDKFIDRTRNRTVVFEARGRMPAGDIRSMSDRKLLQEVSRWRK